MVVIVVHVFMCQPFASIGVMIVLMIGLSTTERRYAQKHLSFCTVSGVVL
jgi:hypothetical protein